MRGFPLVVALVATCLMLVGEASAQRCNVQQSSQAVSTASAVQAAALAQPLLTQPVVTREIVQAAPRTATATATSGRVARFLQSDTQVCTDCQAAPRQAIASSAPPIVTREIVTVPTTTTVVQKQRSGPLSRLFNPPPVSKSVSGPRRSIAVVRG